MAAPPDPVTFGRVRLLPLSALSREQWQVVYGFFRDRELAAWNDARPVRMPEWVFRKVMLDDDAAGDRQGFAALDEHGRVIGNGELYDLRPSPPLPPTTATLGVMIGVRTLWGQGYGREVVQALLRWAFEVREPALQRVRLTTFSHNRRAQRTFAACGFREVGRQEVHTGKTSRTDVYMEIERGTWYARTDS